MSPKWVGRRLPLWALAAVLLISSPALALGPFDTGDDGNGDAGDSHAAARPIGPGYHYGHVDMTDRQDHYTIQVPAGQGLIVRDWWHTGSLDLSVGEGRHAYRVQGHHEHFVATDGGGEFHLVVQGFTDATDAGQAARLTTDHYGFVLRIVDLPPQDDAGSGRDAPADPEDALGITEGEHAGTLGGFDAADVYVLDARAGQRYVANLDTAVLRAALTIGDGTGHVAASNLDRDTVAWTATMDGPVYVTLRNLQNNGYVEDYRLEIRSMAADPLPNLVVASMALKEHPGADPTYCAQDAAVQTVQLDVVVQNVGPGTAAPSSLTVGFDPRMGFTSRSCHVTVGFPDLGPGEAVTIALVFDVPVDASRIAASANIDRWQYLQETDEGDNQAQNEWETPLGSLLP